MTPWDSGAILANSLFRNDKKCQLTCQLDYGTLGNWRYLKIVIGDPSCRFAATLDVSLASRLEICHCRCFHRLLVFCSV